MPTVMNRPTEATSTELKSFLRELRFERGSAEQTAAALRALIDAGLDRLPLPGSGATLERWRMLAAVSAVDLALVKLYEGHTDALAILAELDGKHSDKGNAACGASAAEPPNDPITIDGDDDNAEGDSITLHGTKAWCSGAAFVTHALVMRLMARSRRRINRGGRSAPARRSRDE